MFNDNKNNETKTRIAEEIAEFLRTLRRLIAISIQPSCVGDRIITERLLFIGTVPFFFLKFALFWRGALTFLSSSRFHQFFLLPCCSCSPYISSKTQRLIVLSLLSGKRIPAPLPTVRFVAMTLLFPILKVRFV